MIIDFHTHGKLAKTLTFKKEYTKWLFDTAIESGLEALCLTEHFNTTQFEDLYEFVATELTPHGDCFIYKNQLKVFPGIEIDINEGGHNLVIGQLKDILAIHNDLKPFMKKGHFIPLEGLGQLVKQHPVIFGAAHPYREGGNIPSLAPELLANYDFIDLNGKDFAAKGELCEFEVNSFAKSLEKPVVAGSDTHQGYQYMTVYNNFRYDVDTVEDLKKAVLSENYTVHTASDAVFRVETASTLKKAMKQIDALGGNYVSILPH